MPRGCCTVLAHLELEGLAIFLDLAVPQRLQPLQGPLALPQHGLPSLGHARRRLIVVPDCRLGVDDGILAAGNHLLEGSDDELLNIDGHPTALTGKRSDRLCAHTRAPSVQGKGGVRCCGRGVENPGRSSPFAVAKLKGTVSISTPFRWSQRRKDASIVTKNQTRGTLKDMGEGPQAPLKTRGPLSPLCRCGAPLVLSGRPRWPGSTNPLLD